MKLDLGQFGGWRFVVAESEGNDNAWGPGRKRGEVWGECMGVGGVAYSSALG